MNRKSAPAIRNDLPTRQAAGPAPPAYSSQVRGEKIIDRYGSEGFRATRVAAGGGKIHLTCLTLAPGGLIGTHPATEAQLFLVIAGQGWTAGQDGQRTPITAGSTYSSQKIPSPDR